MQTRRAVRQGDVLVVPVDKSRISGDPVAPKKGRLILAEGEQTGHHHSIKATDHVVLLDNGVEMFLSNQGPRVANLTHQEHATLPIGTGDSEVIQQRRIMPDSDHLVHRVYD